MSTTQHYTSTEMSVSIPEDNDVSGDELLGAVATVSTFHDEIQTIPTDSSWQMKHTDIGRSELHKMRKRGLAEKSDLQMGSATRWTLTEKTGLALEVYESQPVAKLSTEQLRFGANHADAFDRLPDNTDEEFKASQYNLRGGLLQKLHQRGFLRRVTKTDEGTPDVWQATNLLQLVQDFYDTVK